MANGTKSRSMKEFLIYCGCGAVSTFADASVYFPLVNFTAIPAPACVLISTIVSNLIGFLLMKPLVFRSRKWTKEVLVPEFIRYTSTRVVTIFLDILSSFVLVTLLGQDENLMRIIAWTVISLANYFFAKFFVFKRKKENETAVK